MAESKRRRFKETVIEQVDDKASDKSPESPCPSPPLLLSAPQDMDGIEHEATSPVSKDDKASSGWDRKTPPRKQSDRRSASRSPKRRRSRSRERRRRSSPDRRKRRSRSRDRKRRSHSRERRRSHSKERRRSRHSRSPSSPPRRYCSKWAKPSTGLTRAVLSNKPQKKSKEVSIEEVEQRVARHMEAVKEKNVKEAKRINLPGYLNPAMVNVQQFKQVRDKRKLLWSKAQDKKEVWTGAFDDANSEQEKFKRLMGIHGELNAENAQGASGSRVQESKKVLENLEREYEKSRAFQLSRGASGITGMGLGFGSLQPP